MKYKPIEKTAMVFSAIGVIMVLVDLLTRFGKMKAYVFAEAGVFSIVALLWTLLFFCKTDNISPRDRTPCPLLAGFIWAAAAVMFFYNATWKLH